MIVTAANGLSISNGAEVDLYAQNGTSPFNPGSGLYTFDIIGYSGVIQGYGAYGLSVANPLGNTRYLFGTDGNYVTLKVGASPNGTAAASPTPTGATAANWTGTAITPGDTTRLRRQHADHHQ